MKKILNYLFEEVPPEKRWNIEFVAILIFLSITIGALLIGVPPSLAYDFILTLIMLILTPLMILLFVSSLLVFTLLVLHNILPHKHIRREWLKRFREKILKNDEKTHGFEATCTVLCFIGSIMAVIGLTLIFFLGIKDFLINTVGHTSTHFIFMFGGFFMEITLGFIAFKLFTCQETKNVARILRKG